VSNPTTERVHKNKSRSAAKHRRNRRNRQARWLASSLSLPAEAIPHLVRLLKIRSGSDKRWNPAAQAPTPQPQPSRPQQPLEAEEELYSEPSFSPSPLDIEEPETPLEFRAGSPESNESVYTYRIFPDSPPISVSPPSPSHEVHELEEEEPSPGSPTLESNDLEEQEIPLIDLELEDREFERERSSPSPAPSIIIVEEIPYVPPPRRFYFTPGPHRSLESLVTAYPLAPNPLPEGTYALGSHDFIFEELRSVLPNLPEGASVPVSLPSTYPDYHLVPKDAFLNLFPPNTAVIEEIPE